MAEGSEGPHGPTEKAKWTPVEVTALVDYLHEHCAERVKAGNFKDAIYNAAATALWPLYNNTSAIKTGKMVAYKWGTKFCAVILWAKSENFHLTDALLMLIKDSVTWKGALGFNRGAVNDPMPTGKGRSFIQHCEDITDEFFLHHNTNSEFVKDNLPALRTVIKNLINSLKSTFTKYHNKLGKTGHGLVTSGHADELYEGSEATNVYEAIEKKFPWYLQMSVLMGSSPVSSWKAISNSQSYLNLAVLGVDDDADEDETECCTPTLMVDEDVALRSIGPLSPCGNLPSDKLEDEEEEVVFLPKIKFTVPVKHTAESPAVTQSSKKHKTPQDLVKEVADTECEARLMHEMHARECTTRERVKCQAAHDTAVAVEGMHLKSQAEQVAMQWAHELLMLEKQIELAHLHSGYSTSIDPHLQG
ncbi:hypothetical protein PAXRUDRAFT_13422 [Paxillus rubicundulus Ve08.2h10]|uniref:Uncharacterized protein n=1 Tax=Paxillus rubicundulus Ve08.2h10 TaxID=930991 RepID=A0A0D0DLE8_9AGAM|nr:hypothetical protein PAXRUDRAFT_13422 [Paxillus rubicundulus Ve08.2h10]